jgi:hypothetical protein
MNCGLLARLMSALILLFSLSKVSAQKSLSFQDCQVAYPICEIKTYQFGQMEGAGAIQESSDKTACFKSGFSETNSFWLKWKAASSGTLTFVINPNNKEDDFDFVLYKKENDNCTQIQEVRCMAAGPNIGDEEELNTRCKGRTGLSFASVDEFEQQGCKYASDNFLKMLQLEEGEEYVLMINNFESKDGFSITFEGDTQLRAFDDCKVLTSSEPLMIVNLYPNPAVNSVNLEYLAQKSDPVEIDLLDIAGKSHHHFDIIPELGKNKNTFLLNDMAKGSYLVRIKQGTFTTVRQFVKQ